MPDILANDIGPHEIKLVFHPTLALSEIRADLAQLTNSEFPILCPLCGKPALQLINYNMNKHYFSKLGLPVFFKIIIESQ